MSTIFPINTRGEREGKILFCFNPYPLEPIGSNAPDGYLTGDHVPDLINGWGIDILKKCRQDVERTIREDGDSWPFFGYYEKNYPYLGQSLYDFLKKENLIK